MTFWFRIAFTWWQGHFISRYLKLYFMLIKYTCDSKSQTLPMRYSFQSTGRTISHRNGWTFRVYLIPLRNLVPKWNSCPGATTGVNSRRATRAGNLFRVVLLAVDSLNVKHELRSKKIKQFCTMHTFPNDISRFATWKSCFTFCIN